MALNSAPQLPLRWDVARASAAVDQLALEQPLTVRTDGWHIAVEPAAPPASACGARRHWTADAARALAAAGFTGVTHRGNGLLATASYPTLALTRPSARPSTSPSRSASPVTRPPAAPSPSTRTTPARSWSPGTPPATRSAAATATAITPQRRWPPTRASRSRCAQPTSRAWIAYPPTGRRPWPSPPRRSGPRCTPQPRTRSGTCPPPRPWATWPSCSSSDSPRHWGPASPGR